MCGIYGRYDPRGGLSAEAVDRKLDLIAHRGPDGSDHVLTPCTRATLGHRRLAIVELSDLGRQPMQSENGRLWLTYNGEIYNFEDLRQELEALGRRFRGRSDTEVLLDAWQLWGPAALDRVDGMFALAVLETDDAGAPVSLSLARDRAGEKPLYYGLHEGGFSFGSDPALIEGERRIDPDGLNCYLALGYLLPSVDFYRGVHQLAPGHVLRVDLSSGPARPAIEEPYWRLPDGWDGIERTVDELAEDLEPLFVDSVRRRLISDVPVGIFLSGGLDSSLVTAAASRTSSGIRTINVAFPDSGRFDEAEFARQIADHFQTDHQVIDGRELAGLDSAPLFDTFSDPLADSSIIPTYFISKLTREFATVALGGDGGDELFGGYQAYSRSLAMAGRLRHVPAPLIRMVAGLARALPDGKPGKALLRALRSGRDGLRVNYSPYFRPESRRRLLDTAALGPLTRPLDYPESARQDLYRSGATAIEGMTRMDFQTYLPGDILTKVDRASMAVSLEVRAPWLDRRIIDFCFSKIPPHLRATATDTRIVQKALARRMLPKGFEIDRKQGFSLPTGRLSETLKTELSAVGRIEGLHRAEVNKLAARSDRDLSNMTGQLAALTFLSRQAGRASRASS